METPFFCLSSFLSSHFYFLYFSLSYSPAFALSLAVSFFSSPLPPPSLMILAEVWLIGHQATSQVAKRGWEWGGEREGKERFRGEESWGLLQRWGVKRHGEECGREKVSESKTGEKEGCTVSKENIKKGGKLIISANSFRHDWVFSSSNVFSIAAHVLAMQHTLWVDRCVYVQTSSRADLHSCLCMWAFIYTGLPIKTPGGNKKAREGRVERRAKREVWLRFGLERNIHVRVMCHTIVFMGPKAGVLHSLSLSLIHTYPPTHTHTQYVYMTLKKKKKTRLLKYM